VRDDDMAFRTIGMTEADFSLSLSPPELTVPIGSSQTSTITITSWFGFSSPVELSYSWFGDAPSDVAIGLPGPVTPPPNDNGTSTLQVSVGDTATTGAFILRITGTSEAISHIVDVGVEITEAPTPTPSPTPTPTPTPTSTPLSPTPTVTPLVPGCIIATAAYGSELSEEVQFLRSFRDDKVMKTFAGSAFMKAFNAFYYSFSPQVARFISGSPALKASTRVLLYPLMGALHLSYTVFNTISFAPEIAVVAAGFAASALLGALYLFPTASTVLFVLKRRGYTVTFDKAWRIYLVVVASLLAIAFAEVSGHIGLATLGTSLFVVSNIGTIGLTLAINAIKRFQSPFTRGRLWRRMAKRLV
jgi:peptide/nickel transport system substrate-binding protein